MHIVHKLVDEGNWKAALAAWGRFNLSAAGRYVGEPLQGFGFPYRNLQHIPAEERYSAMICHISVVRRVVVVVKGLARDLQGGAA